MYNFSSNTKQPISLESTDTGPLCQCKDVSKDWSARWAHRRDCHKLSYEAVKARNESKGRSTPAMNRRCRTRYGTEHCECFTRRNRLHFRLKSWMPKGLNYCGHCEKFTLRKRGHNGRCMIYLDLWLENADFLGYHGAPKPRKCESKYWTHTSRNGAFGRKIWKKWFNNNAMNRLEARLQEHIPENDRGGSKRYSMRYLEAKQVDTKVARDNKSWPIYGSTYF